MTTAKPTPTEHDLRWLELSRDWSIARQVASSRVDTVIRVAGFDTRGDWGSGRWNQYADGKRVATLDTYQALPIAIELLAADRDSYARSYSGTKGSILDEYNQAVAARRAAKAAYDAHEVNYTGWNRFFLVTSSNGLVHRSMDCSTCNKGRYATTFAMLPALSGLDAKTAVDALGPSLCSVCFPEAPVTDVDGPKIPSRITELLTARNGGQDAFFAELAKYNADADKRAATAAKRAQTKRDDEARRIARAEARRIAR